MKYVFYVMLLVVGCGNYSFAQDVPDDPVLLEGEELAQFQWGERFDILNRRLEKQERLTEGMIRDLREQFQTMNTRQEARLERLESLIERLKPDGSALAELRQGVQEVRANIKESRENQQLISKKFDFFNTRLLDMSKRFAPGLWLVERMQQLVIGLMILTALVFVLLLMVWYTVRKVMKTVVGLKAG